MEISEEDYLAHYGTPRHSGRYPYGSGDNPYQSAGGFKSAVAELKAKGLTPAQIAEGLGLESTTHLRAQVARATEEIRADNSSTAARLAEKGMSTSAIARRMSTNGRNVNESTVRGWLKTSQDVKDSSIRATANSLVRHLEDKPYLDVGAGNHLWMGITETKLRTAVSLLRDEGYQLHSIKLPQLGTGKYTEYKVLTKPGVTKAEVWANRGNIQNVSEHSPDGGQTFLRPSKTPVSVNPKRIEVRYGPDGGAKMDGIIELRRGVKDLDLGESRYGQVRIAVGGTHYLKGMAMYADDLPSGVDIRFNTPKTKAEAPTKLSAMKEMKADKEGNIDPEHPFGATTHPRAYTDSKGKEHTSALNIVGSEGRGNTEGRWDQWSKSLSSQMLSKQPLALAASQLGKARAAKEKDLAEIMSLTNPVVKKKLLEEYADSADAAAVHLKAAHIEGQSTHVILPMNSMRPHEVYAPNFENGQRVALVRHPHGGPFEIPELTVNNKNLTAKRILGNAKDAIGIHHSVAEQLSGADFDGDTVLVIPNSSGRIKSRAPLAGLKNFDAKAVYKIPEGDTTTPRMTKKNTQTEMGKISNLITDMTIHKANDTELAAAVRHSMVVIDAEKHGLNYKKSELDNDIKGLKTKYQGGPRAGASTIISRAGSEIRVPETKQLSGAKGVNPRTGEKVLVPTDRTYQKTTTKTSKRTGETTTTVTTEKRLQNITRMSSVKDARELLSKKPQPMEEIYAAHANSMKTLANEARKAGVRISNPKQSAAAKAVYAKEVASLNAKLKLAQRNAPLERRAQALGNAMAKARIEANPGLDKDEIKKINFASLDEARQLTGAAKIKIGSEHSPLLAREWEAIQAGAISATTLRHILSNADMSRVRELATPRARTSLTPGQLARARSMEASGRTMADIARELGIPRTTLSDNLASD